MEIREDNFRNYVSKIQHLLTDDIGEKMQTGLIAFVKSTVEIKDDDGTDDHDSESCIESQDLRCPDTNYPAHGPDGLGCCAHSAFGCCPDNMSPAPAPFFDVSSFTSVTFFMIYIQGCDCAASEHGCCPDGLTPAQGSNHRGCGCQHEEHGCCPDQQTPALGPDFQECHCSTHVHGCCPDGQTPAKYTQCSAYIHRV